MSIDGTDGPVGAPAAAPDAQAPKQAERIEVRRLAEQFEAMLLTQMLRDMRRSMLSDDQSGGFGQETMTDTTDVELGLSLSRAGGFGLTSSLLGAFERTAGVSPSSGRTPQAALMQYMLDTSTSRAFAAPANGPADIPVGGTPLTVDPTTSGVSHLSTPFAVPGAGVELPGAGAASASPVQSGPISSGYGWRRDPLSGAPRFHAGVDIAMPTGRDVAAAEGGRVVFAGEQSGFGQTILIDNGGGRQTRYAHLSAERVRVGDVVEQGQVIGVSGATGRVTGPHLHFEVLMNGKSVNPLDAL